LITYFILVGHMIEHVVCCNSHIS